MVVVFHRKNVIYLFHIFPQDEVRYSIEGSDAALYYFKMDAQSGNILVQNPLAGGTQLSYTVSSQLKTNYFKIDVAFV